MEPPPCPALGRSESADPRLTGLVPARGCGALWGLQKMATDRRVRRASSEIFLGAGEKLKNWESEKLPS
jgi:hypothetical protein